MSWWSELSGTERALILGGGFTMVSAVFMGAALSRGLRGGVPIKIDLGPKTRGLLEEQVGQTNRTLDRLSERGIPVYVLVGAKTLQARQAEQAPREPRPPRGERRPDRPRRA
jgi:hypothetical protein